ncbi:MAG: TetR/AcrR family transcriptional regulator [Deltaproteobacteria bacterium]|jgi:AcrR family transcriptional regulator|nr:TetR/AcrR family transcriptional regulator [Deltaproteobacteria bacterium]
MAADKLLPAKERIIKAAERLFYDEGIQAIGIDRIIQEAGVALNTLYKYFPSKAVLVERYLRDRDVRWRKWFNSYTRPEATFKHNILSLFDALNDWFHEETFRGCAFINAAGEFGDTKSDIFEISREHKKNIYLDVLKLCHDSNVINPEKLTRQVMIIIEGAIVRAYLNDDKDAALWAKEVCLLLLENYD